MGVIVRRVQETALGSFEDRMAALGRGIDRVFEGIRFRWSDGRYAKASGPSMGERMGERWRAAKDRWRNRADRARMDGWGTEQGGKGRTALQVAAVVLLCGASAAITWYFAAGSAGGFDPATAKAVEALRAQAGERGPSLTGLPTLAPMSTSSGEAAATGADVKKNEPPKAPAGVLPSLKPKGAG